MAQQPEEKKQESSKEQQLNEEQLKIWKEYLSKSTEAQCDLFLNLYWTEFANEKKEEIYIIFNEYYIREKLVGGSEKVGFGPFNLILENIKKKNVAEVISVMDNYGDKASMGKRFIELGFKLNNNRITLLECLMFIFGKNLLEMIDRAPTPKTHNLRIAKKELLIEENKQKQRKQEIDDLQQQLNDGKIKKMKIAETQQKIKKLESDLKNDGVQLSKNLKNCSKKINLAEDELKKEMTAGTDASNWFKEKKLKFPPK